MSAVPYPLYLFPLIQKRVSAHKFNNNNYNTNTFVYLVYNSSSYNILIQNYNFILSCFQYHNHFIAPIKVPFTLNYITSHRPSHPYMEDQTSFYQWLAGFIDGDGHFAVIDGKYPVLFIEQETKNLSVLLFIQSQLGGSVAKRSRGDCYVYNLSSRSEIIVLLHGINGHIRNSIRLPQFFKVCSILNITPMPIIPLSLHNAWFAGFFDADGHISGYFTKTPYIVIQVTNKLDCNLEPFVLFFKGNTYHSKSNDVYKWKIGSKKDVLSMLSYFMMYPSMSHKFNRIGLITPFYNLVSSRAYKETADPVLIDQWNKLMNDWKTLYTISRV